VLQAVRRRLRSDLLPVLQEIESGPDDGVTFDADGQLRWGALTLGRWTGGPDLLEPKVVLGRFDLLEPAERERLRARLVAWRDRAVAGLFAPVRRPPAAELSPPGKGLVHALERGLGAVPRDEVEDLVRGLSDDDRKALAKLDVRLGVHAVFVQSLLRPRPMALRGALWSLSVGRRPFVAPPPDGRTSAPASGAPAPAWRAMGFLVVGPLAIRADVLEQVSAELRAQSRRPDPSADKVTSRLGCTVDEVEGVARALGYRWRRAPDGAVSLQRAR
jgi:ATP-dependent RNA helicase SUPV3L1/SUV3